MKSGSLLVEALIAILIISFSFGIAFLPSYFLLKKSKEDSILLNFTDLLLNKAEEIMTYNVSDLPASSTEVVFYNDQNYILSYQKIVDTNYDLYTNGLPNSAIPKSTITRILITIRSEDGKYKIETEVIPEQ
ncbi:hypothetical protein JYK00_05980 [Thermosipho ferrireducens]|uniref:Type II secretion system protein n=1 Tax=Thermosipho ferrireducens TaxID=2571116 RepID=A0ABX7S852_9BACT|nr:hypothetical protein [Thermosipho ferrireducens]QTA37290.1 hypothetical protein JYK00_05980 [Thermosipho ferrireducens]